MKRPQPFVVRTYLNTEEAAFNLQDYLETQSLYPDVVKSPHGEAGPWKVVFTAKSLNDAATALGKVSGHSNPGFFDPAKDWQKGFTVLTTK